MVGSCRSMIGHVWKGGVKLRGQICDYLVLVRVGPVPVAAATGYVRRRRVLVVVCEETGVTSFKIAVTNQITSKWSTCATYLPIDFIEISGIEEKRNNACTANITM
jgi:hypothetical protein